MFSFLNISPLIFLGRLSGRALHLGMKLEELVSGLYGSVSRVGVALQPSGGKRENGTTNLNNL